MSIYHSITLPDSLDNLSAVLKTAPENTRILAGGTDILLELKQDIEPSIDLMVDVTSIPEMQRIEERDDQIFIGAAAPLSTIASSALINKYAQALQEACRLIGGPQVRNVATLGGNVAHALPAADGSISLLSLDASAEVLGSNGITTRKLSELYLGPGKTALLPKEVIIGFAVKKTGIGQASAFKRIMRPQGVALPILNTAIWLERDGLSIHSIRIAIGPGGPIPTRGTAAELFLIGKNPKEKIVDEAAEILLGCIKLRTSAQRASAAYRKHLCVQLFKDVLWEAWSRSEMKNS
ncbi:MAG: FAD binding domain-containing protein [Anaerolineaceae bacterium]